MGRMGAFVENSLNLGVFPCDEDENNFPGVSWLILNTEMSLPTRFTSLLWWLQDKRCLSVHRGTAIGM